MILYSVDKQTFLSKPVRVWEDKESENSFSPVNDAGVVKFSSDFNEILIRDPVKHAAMLQKIEQHRRVDPLPVFSLST